MKVLYIAAECKPFSKVGGVGDVAGELPVALKKQGVDIEIVTPWYGRTACKDRAVEFHGVTESVGFVRTDLNGVPVNFVKNPTYFENDYSGGNKQGPFADRHLFHKDYSTPYVESDAIPYYDDALRFSFFSEACLALIEKKAPDIVHVNDWPLGFLFGRMAIKGMPQKRVLTIHNIGYQGNLGRGTIKGWKIEELAQHETTRAHFADPHPEWESVNALRLAMELADQVNAVSPTYAKEIIQPENQDRYFEGGKGLDAVARELADKGKLHGILNGFEYSFAPDRRRFDDMIARKAGMKAALAAAFRVPTGFLLGFVGRVVEQKVKLLTEELDGKSVLEHILDIPGVSVAVVGSGQKKYEHFFAQWMGRPNFSATIAYDRDKAEQISLGSDVFLMPSLFEPCGITQMESLRCATPPLVRWTGGLVDTVTSHECPDGTGFGFDGQTRKEVLQKLVATVHESLRLYTENKGLFAEMQWQGFNKRFVWESSAKGYIEKLYEPAMAGTVSIQSLVASVLLMVISISARCL